jgi:hypothetical protein
MATEWTGEQIAAALATLRQPFPLEVVQIKVGATYEKDGMSYGLDLAYADWWTGYLPALQRVLGPGAWNIELTPWGTRGSSPGSPPSAGASSTGAAAVAQPTTPTAAPPPRRRPRSASAPRPSVCATCPA